MRIYSNDPFAVADKRQDSILWSHIIINTAAFGIVFPLGMVLGVSFLLFAFYSSILHPIPSHPHGADDG
jgi:hypothetical protein